MYAELHECRIAAGECVQYSNPPLEVCLVCCARVQSSISVLCTLIVSRCYPDVGRLAICLLLGCVWQVVVLLTGRE
jgi:hypothetical protein